MWGFLLAALLQGQPAPFTTIDRGASSEIDSPRQVVVRTPAEWAALWRAHAPDKTPTSVDFANKLVLGVFLGTRPSAGYAVEIVGTRAEAGALVVRYAETRPGPDAITAQILTAPYHLVAIPARAGAVRFEKMEK